MADESKRNNLNGNPAWTKGGRSPNPGGRPSAARQSRFRALFDKNKTDEEIFERALYWLRSEDSRASTWAMQFLMDRRYGKVPVVDEAGETVTDTHIHVVIPRLEDIEYNPEPH